MIDKMIVVRHDHGQRLTILNDACQKVTIIWQLSTIKNEQSKKQLLIIMINHHEQSLADHSQSLATHSQPLIIIDHYNHLLINHYNHFPSNH